MATKFQNKNLRTNFININIPIRRGVASAFESTTDVLVAAKNNIIALLKTKIGERPLSDFGCNLKNMIFEPYDDELESNVRTEIEDAVGKWLSYIDIVELNTKINERNNVGTRKFEIFLRFKLNDSQYEDELNLVVE